MLNYLTENVLCLDRCAISGLRGTKKNLVKKTNASLTLFSFFLPVIKNNTKENVIYLIKEIIADL